MKMSIKTFYILEITSRKIDLFGITLRVIILVLWHTLITRIQFHSYIIPLKRRLNTVTENNKITNTGMNIK